MTGMNHSRRLLSAVLAWTLIVPPSYAADAWAELAKPGAIVLFRYATAPPMVRR